MFVHLRSTTKLVELVVNGVAVPARIWEGVTADGIACHAYVTRIAVAEGDDQSRFQADLEKCDAPTPAIEAIPLRMVL